MKIRGGQKAYLLVSTIFHITFFALMMILISSMPGFGSSDIPASIYATQVDLGEAAPFAGFGGGSGLTSQGIFTVINGDVGTTGASALITGFHDTGANIYTETPLNIGTVNGTIYSATAPAGSDPGVIAAATALAVQKAFDSLSPAALPGGKDVSSLGGAAGQLGNRTLAPGIYKSAPGTFAIQGGDLTLDADGDPNAVWVFQMATSLTVGGPGAAFPQSVLLVNGAQARNVYWQVGSTATINAAGGGTMVGTIISSAATTFSTAGNVAVVTLEGRALAMNASVTMVNTRINVPARQQPVTVSSTIPVKGATGVPIDSKLSVTFSGAMDPSTINRTTFTVKQGDVSVAGSVAYSGVTAVFTPASYLAPGTPSTATITTGARDQAGNALATDYVWNFTTGAAPDIIKPTVSSRFPVNAATNVPIDSKLSATFSEAMDPATINATTLTLKHGATAVSGTVAYTGITAVFTPTGALAGNTLYTATISTGATDLAGNSVANDYVWNFTTGAAPDSIKPAVISTDPADLATGVAVNKSIAATFSETMNPLTITTATFTLQQGAATVSGTAIYSGVNAVFTPTNNLVADTVYTATITTGAKDLAGNLLAGNHVWSFTTAAAATAGPAPVNLGTAGNFVILAKTGVSTTGTTAVVGDIGVSPVAASYLTGFSLIADATNNFSTSSVVNGKLFASDYAPPTPAIMTTAVSDMQTAFTDAAGRTTPDFTELGAGDISGLTLVPGLYKWGTGVSITNGVTFSGGANDVWILQIAQDLLVNNSAIVTLTGGAQAKNIFWQVSGQANLGTAADFKGIILSQTLISLNTGSKMTGRALAQTAVTLNATAITAP